MITIQTQYAADLSNALLTHVYQRFCGIEVLEQRPGYCRSRIQVTESIDNLSQTLHGGVLYSMLDVTSMLATIPLLELGEYALSASFNASMLSATKRGETVEIEAAVVKDGRTAIFTRCTAWKLTPAGVKTIAMANVTKIRLKSELPATNAVQRQLITEYTQ